MERSSSRVTLLVATRKGAWLYHGDANRETWRADGPHFLGHIITHLVLDPRDPGIRFRMIDEQERVRPHIRFFVNGEQVRSLSQQLGATDEVAIVQALSGG